MNRRTILAGLAAAPLAATAVQAETVSPELSRLIDAHEAARLRVEAACHANADDDAVGELCLTENEALQAILAYRPHSLEEARCKARFLAADTSFYGCEPSPADFATLVESMT